jgi:hypothetical protein
LEFHGVFGGCAPWRLGIFLQAATEKFSNVWVDIGRQTTEVGIFGKSRSSGWPLLFMQEDWLKHGRYGSESVHQSVLAMGSLVRI